VIGCHVIVKNGANDIAFHQASEYKEDKKKENQKKLMNIVFHNNKYFIYEPKNKDENEENIIENHLWLVMKYLPKRRHELKIGDVIRFGRIPFKVERLVLNPELEQKDI